MTTPAADPYLGHESTIERLLDPLADAATGRGSWTVVRGPSGSGTTATAREIATRAADQGFTVLWGACHDGLAGRPFDALAEALDEHARRSGAAALYTELGDAAPALARLAPAVRSVLPATPPPAPLEPVDEMLRLNDALLIWLMRASAERPLLFVIDDLQSADADLLRFLDHLSGHLGRLSLFILSSWADDDSAVQQAVPPSASVVELAGLDEDATAAWLARHADRPISVAALGVIQEVSAGHPLASLELYRHLRDEGFIGRAGGDSLPAAGSLPQTLDEIVAWRLVRLSLEQRAALAALACFSRPVSAVAVAAVSGLSRARAVDALEASVGLGFVLSVEGSGMYQVAHPRVGRILADSLSKSIRAEALGRVAEALETELGDDVRPYAAELAELYARVLDSAPAPGTALQPGRAAAGIRHCLVAAEQSRSAAAYNRAADCLALAHRLASGAAQPTQYDLLVRLMVAHAEADRPGDALAAAERVAARPLDAAGAEGLVAAARALRDHGRVEASARLRELLEGGWRDDDELIGARLELLAGRWEAVEVENVRARVWLTSKEGTHDVVVARGDEQDRSELFAAQRARGHQQTVELLEQARNWTRPASLLRALHGASVDLATRLGLFHEARSWATEYAAAAERYGAPVDRVRALSILAQCQALMGDFAAADDGLAAADEVIGRLPASAELAAERLMADFVVAHYREADWPTLLARAAELTARPHPAGMLLAAETSLALARSGDSGRAAQLSDAVLDLAAQWPPLTYLRDSALLVALSAAWEGGRAEHTTRARSLVQLAVAAGAGGNHTANPQLAVARTYALAGQLAEARPLFASAREEAEAAGLAPQQAILDHDEGIALAGAGPGGFGAAAALLEQAAAAFERLGMAGWQARTRGLLDGGLDAATEPGGRLHFTYPRGLSRREADLVRLLNSGSSLGDAAAELELEPAIAERHLASAMAKLQATSIDELHQRARRYGLGGAI